MKIRFTPLLGLALVGAGCSGARIAQPKDLTAGQAAGEAKCDPANLTGEAMTFVADWQDGQRSALDSAMSKGVAVVTYSCDGVKVLPACRVAGDYAYAGGTRRQKLIQMNDQFQAQTQLGGRMVGAAFEGALSQGRSLSLAYVTVGANSTAVASVTRDMLTGRCEGATHFVYEAEVGAFAVNTHSKGEAAAFAAVFGQGSGSAQAASDKGSVTQDGELEACDRAGRKDRAPVDRCEAIVRISLLPVEAAGQGRLVGSGVVDTRSCPAGFVYADEECVPKGQAKTYLCETEDYAGCFAQCEAGHAGSCGRLGVLYLRGSVDPRTKGKSSFDRSHWGDNVHKVVGQMAKACEDAGEANACAAASDNLARADDVKYNEKVPASVEAATSAREIVLAELGCRGGEGFACMLLMEELNASKPRFSQPRQLVEITEQACSRSPVACAVLGGLKSHTFSNMVLTRLEGKLPKDGAGALRAFQRACDANLGDGCYGLGLMQLPAMLGEAIYSMPKIQEQFMKDELAMARVLNNLHPPAHDQEAAVETLRKACRLGKQAFLYADFENACALAK